MLPKNYLYLLTLISLITICKSKDISLTFVIDDTYSMVDDIRQVNEAANNIMDVVLNKKSSQVENIVLVTFNDPGTRLVKKTKDRYEFKNALNSIEVHGGGDCPEMSMSGIKLALEESLPGSRIYVFTDASAKDHYIYEQVIDLCQKKQIQIVFVLTGYCGSRNTKDYMVYHEIARSSSGQVFQVRKNEVHKVIVSITKTIEGPGNVITSKLIPADIKSKIPFTIDDNIEYAVVTTSGQDVDLDIVGPSNNQQRTVWLQNVKEIRLNNPVPGDYNAVVKGRSTTSVQVFARTDFTFEHGFSELVPKSLKDTSKQPIKGTKHYLTISVTDPESSVHIKSAQILKLDENLLTELPLKKIGHNLYITDDFFPPEHIFKVAVIGTGKNGNTVRRIAKTPVEPQNPRIKPIEQRAPITTISEGPAASVQYGTSIQLTCRVSAYPKPIISWHDKNGNQLGNQSSAVELPYEYISYLKVQNIKEPNNYKCFAKNILSEHDSTVAVHVTSPFEIIKYPGAVTRVQYGQDVTIECNIKSSLPMKIIWSAGDKKINENSEKHIISAGETRLTIKNTDIEDASTYSCVAFLIEDKAVSVHYDTKLEIQGLAIPEIEKSKNPLEIMEKSAVDLSCKIIKGNPKPQIIWYVTKQGSMEKQIVGSKDTLHLSSVTIEDSGTYTCIATNKIGEDQNTIELMVTVPARIENNITDYEAVVGDIALRIPCNAVGNPKPNVAWEVNGEEVMKKDVRYSVVDGTLVIDKPNENDSNKYKCDAINAFGKDTKTFAVSVTKHVEFSDDAEKVYVLKGSSKDIKCPVEPIADGDLIRWFVNGVYDHTGLYLSIKNSTEANDGNYTCRVSNKLGAKSVTIKLDVGSPPRFEYDPIDVINWNGEWNVINNCRLKSQKPQPKIEWLFNGELLKNENGDELQISNWGEYTCRISNALGRINRTMTVTSKDCSIRVSNDRNAPVILTESLKWPEFDEFLSLKSNEKVHLSCNDQPENHNRFENLNVSKNDEFVATCHLEDKFVVNNDIYKFSDLKCEKQIMPTLRKTESKCLYENSETIQIGFNVGNFINVYEVCYDNTRNITLYSKVDMLVSTINDVDVELEKKWFKYGSMADNQFEDAYNCGGKSNCCYKKSQLVNAQDVSFGAAQIATFVENVNAVPYWSPCDKTNIWENVENEIRRSLDEKVTVWTGVSKLAKNDSTPRFLWKVVKDRGGSDKPTAIIYVNHPSPQDDDKLCEDICGEVDWLESHSWPMYCCRLADFAKAFDLPIHIFE